MKTFKIVAMTAVISGMVFIAGSSAYAAFRVAPLAPGEVLPADVMTRAKVDEINNRKEVIDVQEAERPKQADKGVYVEEGIPVAVQLTVEERLQLIEMRLEKLEANQK